MMVKTEGAQLSRSVYNVWMCTHQVRVRPRQENEGSRIPAAQSLTLQYTWVEYIQCVSAHTPTEITPSSSPPKLG